MAESVPVTSVPGASAVLTGLQLSTLPSDRFLFAGFPPNKQVARGKFFGELAAVPASLIFYESPRRLAASLADMAAALGGGRQAAVARELTKKFEETRRGRLEELAAHYAAAGAPRGEIVIVVAPPEAGSGLAGADEVDRMIRAALAAGGSVKDVAADVAAASGWRKKEVYARALDLRGENG